MWTPRMSIDERNPSVLICIPNNFVAKRLYQQIFSFNPLAASATIIRMYSVTTKKEMLFTIARNEYENNVNVINAIMQIEFPQLNVVATIFGAFHETQKRSFDIKDRRYVHHFMSLTIWMLKIAEISEKDFHPQTDRVRHHQFLVLFNKFQNGLDLNTKQRKLFTTTVNGLKMH